MKADKNSASNTYPGYKRFSVYLNGYGGVRLATDIVIPIDGNGIIAAEKLPVILVASRGGRWSEDFDIEKSLISKGYVFVIIEMRGCGASFGVNDSFASAENRKDIAAVIGWLRAQDWCSGNIGMIGGSNRGFIQLAVASAAPEGLKSIAPAVANIDFYYQNYPNGVSAIPTRMLSGSSSAAKKTKKEFLETVVPVDEDINGDMAYEAYEKDQFPNNKNFVGNLLLENMFRDSSNPNYGGDKTNLSIPPVTNTAAFKKSGIKLYQFGGWFDSNVLGQFIAQKSWGGLLTMGPWNHFECCDGCRTKSESYTNANIDLAEEYLLWFDYTLKGIDNGFDQRPPIKYYTIGAKPGEEWRYAESWPVHSAVNTKLYFEGTKSGTAASQNDGSLSQIKPEAAGRHFYKVDTSIKVFDNRDGKSGTFDRMNRQWSGNMAPDVDNKGLTYTSSPLFPVYENEITGTPSIDLWVTSNASDCDFIAYLEEVLPDGTSKFITEGQIRASHRITSKDDNWEAVGAAYHPSFEEDCKNLLKQGMGEPVHLSFALEPVSYVFGKGSRIRVTVTCADTKTFQHPMYKDALPEVEICLGSDKASFISLPFVEHSENVFNGTVSYGSYNGPGTLYMFKEKMYLNYGGVWKSWSTSSLYTEYEVRSCKALFNKAGFEFKPEGIPIKNGIAQAYKGGQATTQPFPARRHLHVAAVPTQIRPEMLFVPEVKNLLIDLFMPDNRLGKVPCIIFIHGYGGSISVLNSQLTKLIDRGFAVAGIDLRNYPPNFAPDHIHDIKGSVRYLRANADKFGIDQDRIGVYGFSLGGNMALMLAVSGDDEEFEGTVGGNLEYSSRVQAAVPGFAWSDVLYMGYDLADEYSGDPQMVAQKLIVSDGEFSPSCEIFGFSGKGKGIGVLRAYIEAGKEGTNELYDRKIAEAKHCSPLYHIKPDAPPIALFHGLGMTQVHIPNNQTYRTFEALSRNDTRAFMFSNTQGEYGDAPEIHDAIISFFNNYLKSSIESIKAVFKAGSKKAVVNNLSRTMESEAFINEAEIMLPVSFISEIFNKKFELKQVSGGVSFIKGDQTVILKQGDSQDGYGEILSLKNNTLYVNVRYLGMLAAADVKWFEDRKMITFTLS